MTNKNKTRAKKKHVCKFVPRWMMSLLGLSFLDVCKCGKVR